MSAFVAYLRVSTQRQGDSGLGLEAQRASIERYTSSGVVLATYTEVESGKRCDRPQLVAAIKRAKMTGATLIIAKLDRLARNVHFISGLMESGVEFVACDMPQANRLTLHVMAAFAEHEAELISQRTKAALAAAKARGKKLGGYRGSPPSQVARAKASAVVQEIANTFAASIAPLLSELRACGHTTLAAKADALNARQIAAPRGGQWTPMQVRRVEERVA